MPALSWHNVLPAVLLKLTSRSRGDTVVSDQPTESSSQRTLRLESLWAGAAAQQSQQDSYTALVEDSHDPSSSSEKATSRQAQQEQPSPFSEPGLFDQNDSDYPYSQAAAAGSLPVAKPVLDGLLPSGGRHRRTTSAASDISLVSANTASTQPGVFTGITQSGQYDLTQDVILRGEFITASQSKAS